MSEMVTPVSCDNSNNNGDNGNTMTVVEQREEEDESEDEDVDFNPFLKGSLSEEEASSSLSSEVECLDTDVVDSYNDGIAEQNGEQLGCVVGNSEENEGTGVGNDEERDRVSGLEDGYAGEKAVVDLGEEEDAICRRTRARYSLAGFTLDELESFLQESDDEEDVLNVDEEEEYRKFLAAVLRGEGNGEGNIDVDEEEDNDADFEIEIEEALESDVDDCVAVAEKDGEVGKSGRRPKARQKRGEKNKGRDKKGTRQGKRTLRPLVPITPNGPPIAPVPGMGTGYVPTGFMAHQIGQLHWLIHEHVQLLVQTYSLCVLDPARQAIAPQVKGLLLELIHKRDLVLAWKNFPYPSSCFVSSKVHPSVPDLNKQCLSKEDPGGLCQRNPGQGRRLIPSAGGPVVSVLDVAPLKLVDKFVDEVSNAVREHQRRCVEATNTDLEKQPLFPLPTYPFSEENSNVPQKVDLIPSEVNIASPNSKLPKKTLAATLVESTKKQSVALVPRHIAKLAQPFYSLFNPSLFPHKSPPFAVANRVLFTDAEDELLALGILEYNNDWKAIRQRFLPCKSEHQIFVRAKNRCSSKAPDNPIKAVRKMKTSPLTEEEKMRIQEGLQLFKLDWTAIWRTMVPYRDPNLLCRQWRTAIGTQKSYKVHSIIKKEKRRVYESNRRRIKAATLENSPSGSENEDDHTEISGGQNDSGDDCVDNGIEACLHEAFLADWRPTAIGVTTSNFSASSLKSRLLPQEISTECHEVQEGPDNQGKQESQSDKNRTCEVPVALLDASQKPYMSDGCRPSKSFTKSSAHEPLWRSHRSRKTGNCNFVKLAPELPPVKLPPAVRVIPQSSFRIPQVGKSTEGTATGLGIENTACGPTVSCCSDVVKSVYDTSKILNPNATIISSQKSGTVMNGCLTEGGNELDRQMHPLLFRTLEETHSPCYPSNSASGIPTFSFFPVGQRHINVNLLNSIPSNSSPISFSSKEVAPSSSSLDFHPLLQRNNNLNVSSIAGDPSSPMLSTDLELSRDGFRTMREGFLYHAGAAAAQLAASTRPTSPCADANGLNLDICLSSVSRKRKASGQEGAEINLAVPSVSGPGFIEGGNEKADIHQSYSELSDCPPEDSVASEHADKSGSENSATLLLNLGESSGARTSDNVGDQALSEIVMEQEELSDSEEEMEDVEFECEEMADSEGEEESVAEQIVNPQNKEQAAIPLGTDGDGQNSKSVACPTSEGNRAQRKGRAPKKNSAGRGKGSRSSWLSLNYRGFDCSPRSRARSRENAAEGTLTPSLPNRSSKRVVLSTESGNLGEQTTDISKSCPPTTQSRKSRKQASKVSSPLGADLAVGNDSCTEKGVNSLQKDTL